MVNPAYFFSTLAQVSATIVGFIIAFSVGLYPLERRRREDRTDRLREALRDFRDEYKGVVQVMSLIAHDGGVTTKAYLKDFSKGTDELRDEIDDDNDQRSEDAPIVWAHLYRIDELLDRVSAENDFLLLPDELESLQNSLNWLYGYFDANNDSNKQFYFELSDLIDQDNIPDDYYIDDVYDSGAGASNPEGNLRQWIRVESDGRHRSWVAYSADDSGISGRNLFSFATVLEYMKQDFDEVEARNTGTILDYEPRIKYIIRGVLATSVVGVLLPMLFLFAPPQSLSALFVSGWPLYIAEWIILVLTTVAFVYLMYHVVEQFKQISEINRE